MRGIKTFTLSLAALAASAAYAQVPEYFPLDNGNSWLYKAEGRSGKDVRSIDVTGTVTYNGQNYFTVEIFGKTVPVRLTDKGNLLRYNAATQQEEPWLMFAEPRPFPTSFDACVSSGRVLEETEKLPTPFGDIDHLVHIKFDLSCADAGVTDAWFAPYIGMVRYDVTTIAGPRSYLLVHSKTGVTEVSAGMVSTKLSLDSSAVKPDADGAIQLAARLAIRNTTDKPITFNFRSGQRFDLNVKDASGKVVYVWSADKLFVQALGSETVLPRGERSWPIAITTSGLRPGRYVAEAWLTADNTPEKAYSASVGFEVVE